MSKPIRYGLADTDLGRIHPQADGHIVMWADYAALAAENERLRVDNKRMGRAFGEQRDWLLVEPAHYNRLLKAGDELYKWAGSESRPPMHIYAAWNAAKEGGAK